MEFCKNLVRLFFTLVPHNEKVLACTTHRPRFHYLKGIRRNFKSLYLENDAFCLPNKWCSWKTSSKGLILPI